MINPGFARKKRSNTKRIALIVILLLIIAIGAWFGLRSKPSSSTAAAKLITAPGSSGQLAAAESGLLPWQLQAPLSRMAVYNGPSANQLVLAGGLTSSGQSVNQIYTLNTSNGSLTMTGNLPSSLHDAASAQVGNH